MRASLRGLVSGAATAANESWMLNFLSSANRGLPTRRAGSAKSQRIRNWTTNLVDYQTLEARQMLIGGVATIEFALNSPTALEDGTYTTGPILEVQGDLTLLSNPADRTISFTIPTGADDFTVGNFTFLQADYSIATQIDVSDAIVVQNDNLVEGDEEFNVSIDLLTSVFTFSGSNSVTTGITDNEQAEWNLTQSSTSVVEGVAQTYTFSLTPSGSGGGPYMFQDGEQATIEIQVVDMGTEIGVDYPSPVAAIQNAVDTWNTTNSPTNGTLSATFAGGAAPVVLTYTAGDGGGGATAMPDLTVNITATDDSLVEGPESVQISIANPGNAMTGGNIVLGANNSVTTGITDNDTATWSFTQDNAVITEGDLAVFTVSLAGKLQDNETATIDIEWTFDDPTLGDFDFTTTLSTAITEAVADYNFGITFGDGLAWNGTTLTYTAGDDGSGGSTLTDVVIQVATFDDTDLSQLDRLANLVELDKSFNVTISEPGGTASLVTTAGTLSLDTLITDNESASVSISSF